MGARIEAATVVRGRTGILAPDALRLADGAARSCLEHAGRTATELDLLVNVGMYKDENTAEPAFASLVQEDIGANPGHPPQMGRHGTFSFDVLNGGCGFLTAAHLIDGFVRSGAVELGLVVAEDVDPSPHTSRGFAFTPSGGAVLLGGADEGAGFSRFAFRTFAEDAALFSVDLVWEPLESGGLLSPPGRNVLEVHEDRRFADRCVERATEVATGFLDACGIAPQQVDLLIASPHPASFGPGLAAAIGVHDARVPRVGRGLGAAHTVGPIATLEVAIASGAFGRAETTLFVTAGAGITIAAALYRATGKER